MQNLLNSAYSRESWISFLQNRFLPDDFQLRKEVIAIDFKSNYIQPTAFWIGDCTSLGDLAIIEISHNSAKDPRIGVSRDAFRLMALHNLDKALFFFVSDNSKNFRFSLITLDLQLKDKRVEYQFSNPKRFSFFLGEGAKTKTPQNFLIAKNRVRSFTDLQERFSVEVVNKEFYQEIQSLFYRLVGGKIKLAGRLQDFPARLCLPGTKDRQQMQEFGVRLIGRLVFCWFLKKKLSDAGLPLIPEAVLSSMAVMDSYYHKVLEPLFFEILNTPLGKRSSEFRSPLYDKIPFLNGGLFDPSLHQDFYYHPTSAQKHQPCYALKVPDDWLRDFFSTLETYNFTIDENIPIDIDLSVDPEMLGRIFENLLAEINPETGKNAQNATGSFYTPRPIVEYMVDESLIQYLLHKSSVSEAVLRALLDYNIEEVELSKAQCGEILKALDSIKVLDPACGSGAFPIGILQKMLLILQKVDPESVDWLILQLDKVPVSIRKSVEDKMMNENWNYQHKMGIIQNAIYGVDLQPVATEISKLRLFLTLIVDEKIIDNQPNRNINPLPNLSFKFVSANTLLPLPDPQEEAQMEALDFDSVFEPKIKAMQRAREDYFFAYGEAKEKLIQKFKDIQSELNKEFYATGSVNKRALALAKWEPFSDEPNDWFDPAWIFGIDKGFDLVIGNPPWIQSKAMDKKDKDVYKESFVLAHGQYDISNLFIEKTIQLLNDKSFLSFILPNRFLTNIDYAPLREFLLRNTSVLQVIDLGDDVFSNVNMPSAILLVCNAINIDNAMSFGSKLHDTMNSKPQVDILSSHNYIFPVYSSSNHATLLKKINDKSIRMKELFNNARGVEIGKSSLAIYDQPAEGRIALLRGEDIDRYFIDQKVYIQLNLDNINYKASELYENEKILIRKTGEGIRATIDNEFRYVLQVIYIFKLQPDSNYTHKFVLSILNSSLLEFWYHNTYGEKDRKTFPHLTQGKVKTFPIPRTSQNDQRAFADIVEVILKEKNKKVNTQSYEDQIDLMVYKLYDLNYEEMRLIDPNIDQVLAAFGLDAASFAQLSLEDLQGLSSH